VELKTKHEEGERKKSNYSTYTTIMLEGLRIFAILIPANEGQTISTGCGTACRRQIYIGMYDFPGHGRGDVLHARVGVFT